MEAKERIRHERTSRTVKSSTVIRILRAVTGLNAVQIGLMAAVATREKVRKTRINALERMSCIRTAMLVA